jgi:hypothetical protein
MKKILITTIGEQEKPLYEGVKLVPQINKIYLLASSLTEKNAKRVKENISKLYSTEIVIVNEKELDLILNKIIEIHKMEKNAEFFYNLTGGTKVMCLACQVVASFLGEKMFYLFKKEDNSTEVIEIPVLKYSLNKIVAKGDKRHEILKLLREKTRTLTELSKILKLKKPTLSAGHIKKLKELGFVTNEEKLGNKQILKLTKTGEMFFSLLEVENTNG